MNETFNLLNLNIYWWHIGDLTKTGHPRHPSRVPYVGLKPMDIEDYIKILYEK